MRALHVVLAVLLAGSVFVQVLFVVLLAIGDEDPGDELWELRVPLTVVMVLGIVAAQVVVVCVWRLVTMARRGTVFSHAAFRYVDVMIGAIVAVAVAWFAFTGLVAAAERSEPGDEIGPGVILIMGGVGVAILGVALVVLVLRMLLVQAIARDVEAAQLRDELGQVI